MSGRRQLPPVDELVRMRNRGMTMREIADHWFEESGERVTPGAVAVALSRAGHTEPTRYADLIPWRVRMAHQKNFHLRMLRAEARRRAGGLPDDSPLAKRMEEWKQELRELDAVVHYNPAKGFLIVKRRPGIDRDMIRVPCPKCGTEPTEQCKHDAALVRG